MSRQNRVEMREFADRIGIAIQTATQKVVMDAHRGVVEKTPVDTGRARASWRVAEGQLDLTTAPEGPHEFPSLELGIKITGEEIIYISNNLPYAEPLENGHSQQAPAGMVGLTLAEIEAELEDLLPREIN